MIQKRTQQKITMGKFVLPIVMLFSIAIWVLVYFYKPTSGIAQTSSPFWNLFVSYLPQEPFGKIMNIICYGVIGYFLIEFNNTFAIIRLRATIQTSIYFIVIAACPQLYPLHAGSIAVLFMTTSIYFLFQSYQVMRSSNLIFYSWLCLGIASILFPHFLYLIPLYIIGSYNFQSLNFKSFFAGIIGLLLPLWFLFAYAYYFCQTKTLYSLFEELCSFEPISIYALTYWQIATLAFLFIFFVIAMVHSLATGWQDKIRTRSYLNFFSLLEFFLFILILLQPHHFIVVVPLLLVGFSFLTGHFLALTKNRISNIYFIVSLVGLITLFLYNLWML